MSNVLGFLNALDDKRRQPSFLNGMFTESFNDFISASAVVEDVQRNQQRSEVKEVRASKASFALMSTLIFI